MEYKKFTESRPLNNTVNVRNEEPGLFKLVAMKPANTKDDSDYYNEESMLYNPTKDNSEDQDARDL